MVYVSYPPLRDTHNDESCTRTAQKTRSVLDLYNKAFCSLAAVLINI